MDILSLFDKETSAKLLESTEKEINAQKDTEQSIVKEIKESVSIFNKTAYILCEKKSFRSDALYTLFSEKYNTDIVYAVDEKIPEFHDPLCFIVDVTAHIIADHMAQQICFHIQDIAADYNIPIFLIGEPEDLYNLRRFTNHDNLNITKFERPIDTKHVVSEISSLLLTSTKKKKRKHLLLIDDSLTFLRLMRKLLENKYRITTASSALEAIKILSVMLPKTPDALVIDNKMTVCSGIMLIEMLREDAAFEDLPMVICSASGETDEIIKAMPVIDGYILKSKPLAGIDKFIEEVIEKKKKECKHKENSKKNK